MCRRLLSLIKALLQQNILSAKFTYSRASLALGGGDLGGNYHIYQLMMWHFFGSLSN